MDGDTQLLTDEPLTMGQRAGRLAASPRVRRNVLIAGAVMLGLLLLQVVFSRVAYVSTADARIASEMVAVSSDVAGRVTAVGVKEGDRVRAGDILYAIDPREAAFALAEYEAEARRLRAEIAREEARAGLATSKAGSEVAARRAGTRSASASVEAARSNLDIAEREHARTNELFEQGLLPKSAYDQARNAMETASQSYLMAEAERETAAAEQRTASISGEEVRLIDYDLDVLDAELARAEARVEAQRVVLDQHTIRSPINGVVDELFYDAGEHSLQGFRMALLHDPDAVWVSANIKETAIRDVYPGASVIVRADSHPGRRLKGTVTQVHEATLAEAAMMQNPNASGVFTKITQRINVRIDLAPTDLKLRTGTMVTVRIRKEAPDPPPAP
jgi:membrane fusion protein, multidrug efflux system